MSSVNIDLAADTILNVMVGQQDENEVREVVFDFSDWYTTYGSGTISLAIQRPKDEWPYEGTLTVDNSTHKATWEISDTDSAYAGVGQIQLSYTVGTAVKKSVVYRFTVHKSLGALGNVITPIQIQTFIDEVTEALEDMQEELNDVKQDLGDLSQLETEAKNDLVSAINEANQHGGSGDDAVPTEVRQAISTLLNSAIYSTTGLADEKATVASWASEVTAITLNQSSISISGATTSQLTATTTPSGGTVTWSSSNTAVATVSSNGLVTGVGNGTAIITASSGNAHATCTVTVSGFATLTSISAVYTQSGTVYTTDSLDSLKTDLVVTAHWDVGADTTISSNDYTLSGTLTEGTSTIVVSYGGKTDTFDVTVTEFAEEIWINDCGVSGQTANFTYAPFVLKSGTYTYDYSKSITALEADFTTTGKLAVGYYKGDLTTGVAYNSSDYVEHEELTVSATGVQKLTLSTPLQIPSGYSLAIGNSTSTANFKYGGTSSFLYVRSGNLTNQTKKLGFNVYRG